MNIAKRSFSFCFFIFFIFIYSGITFFLKGRNDITYLIFMFAITFTYMLALSKFSKKADIWMCFLFPVSIGISKVIWIAHPLHDSFGVLQVGAGLYFTLSDVILTYFLWRVILIKKEKFNLNAMFVYLTFVLCSIIFAENKEFAFWGSVFYIKCNIIYKWFSCCIYCEKQKEFLLRGFEFASIFQGGIAILQKINNGPIGLQFLGESESALRFRDVGGIVDRGAAGTFSYSSHLAVFILFTLLIVLYYENSKRLRFIFIPWCGFILYLAASRTAMVILVGSLFYGVWKNKSKFMSRTTMMYILLVIPVVLFGIYYALNNDLFAFFTNSDISYQIKDRLAQWSLAFSLISERGWILGYGINNYTTVTTQIGTSLFMYVNPVHNNYILNWFEVGILGVIAYIAIFVNVLIDGKNFKKYDNLKKGSFLFIICVLIYNMTGWGFATFPSAYFLWMSLGILKNKTNIEKISEISI